MSELLDQSIYQVLYHSRATQRPSEGQLRGLLAQSERSNARHRVTGLLLYSDGRYVQVLEGARTEVEALYARIRCDPRHQQVVTVSEGLGPQRLLRIGTWASGTWRRRKSTRCSTPCWPRTRPLACA